MDPVLLLVLSDLLVNLSAGWFGAVFIVVGLSKRSRKKRIWGLIYNILLAIVSIAAAFILRKQI